MSASINLNFADKVSLAASHGDLDALIALREHESYQKAHDYHTLEIASYHGHLNIVRYLKEAGVDTTTTFHEAIRLAAQYGHLEVVKYLNENGSAIKALKYFPHTDIAEKGHLHVIKYLEQIGLERGTNILFWDLCFAAKGGQLEVVQYFHRKGVNLNGGDDEDGHAMEYAAINGHLHIARYFIEQGIDMGLQRNAVLEAAAGGHAEMVELLMRHGANYKYEKEDISERAQELIDAVKNKIALSAGQSSGRGTHDRIAGISIGPAL